MKHSAAAAFLLLSGLLAGCAGNNQAPVYDAGANRTLKLPETLSKPGTQAKIRMPGQDVYVLVWRTEIGFGGTDLHCPHCMHDLVYVAETQTLDCPTGRRFRLDGSFLDGIVRAKEIVRPLRSYLVELDGDLLKILG